MATNIEQTGPQRLKGVRNSDLYPDGGNLIWYDSLQLCPSCYERFTASAYNQRVMLINSIKCYRRLISKYEDNGNIQLDCNF